MEQFILRHTDNEIIINVEDRLVIGKALQRDLFREDPYVSKQHIKLMQKDERLFVKDLGATNTAIVGGKELYADETVEISVGEIIQIGEQSFVLERKSKNNKCFKNSNSSSPLDRFLATCLDSIPLAVTYGLSYSVNKFFLTKYFEEETMLTFAKISCFVIFYALYFYVMLYRPLHKYGATFGKKCLGLKVVKTCGAPYLDFFDVIVREVFGKVVSSGVLFLGVLMIFFNKEKKCLHDIISKTRVIKNQ